MKTFYRIIACVALTLGIGVAGTSTASAAKLFNCSGPQGSNWTQVACSGIDFNQAGQGQVRAVAGCRVAGFSGVVEYVGPWVGRGVTSWVSCPANWYLWYGAYQLR